MGAGQVPSPARASPLPVFLKRTSLQRLEGLRFAPGILGGLLRLFRHLPSIHAPPRAGHLCSAPSTQVAAHWGRAGLVGVVGQRGEKAEATTCGHGQSCEVPARTFPDFSSNFPLSPPLSRPLAPAYLLQRLHNPQRSLQSPHPCEIRPRRAERRWARPSFASAALPPCLGETRNRVLKSNT